MNFMMMKQLTDINLRREEWKIQMMDEKIVQAGATEHHEYVNDENYGKNSVVNLIQPTQQDQAQEPHNM